MKLTNFRSYQSFALKCDQRHVVLTGANGAGKTNILEALSFLSPGRGMRRAAYDLVARSAERGGDGTFAIHTELSGISGPVSIGTGVQTGSNGLVEPGRKVRINGANALTSERLLDHARLLWLTPANDGLFTGATADRRRFLDRMVLALDPLHGRRVTDFEKAMRSRNRLLEDPRCEPQWLEAVELQMSELGAAIVIARLQFTSALAAQFATAERAGPFPQADLALGGSLEATVQAHGDVDDAGHLEDFYSKTLRDGRHKDRAAGRTLHGPHRTDLFVRHRAKDMPAALCSTGEQKALLIGLVLAHARLVAHTTGAAPFLLLDEIAAHLDRERRASLFSLIDDLGGQAWLTGTDQSLFEAMGERAQCFHVEEGVITPV